MATGISLVVVIWLLELFSHFISYCGSKMRHLIDLVVSNYNFFYMSRFPIVTFLYVAVSNYDFLIYTGFETQNLFDIAFLNRNFFIYCVLERDNPKPCYFTKCFCSYAILSNFLIFYANSLKSPLLFCFYY